MHKPGRKRWDSLPEGKWGPGFPFWSWECSSGLVTPAAQGWGAQPLFASQREEGRGCPGAALRWLWGTFAQPRRQPASVSSRYGVGTNPVLVPWDQSNLKGGLWDQEGENKPIGVDVSDLGTVW